MKSVFGLAVFCTTVAAWGFIQQQRTLRTPLPGLAGPQGACTIWFVGSSTIFRWSTLARDMAPWTVRNRGVGGASLSDLQRRFAVGKTTVRPTAIVIYAGENDIAAGSTGAQAAAAFGKLVGTVQRGIPGVPVHVVGLKPSPARWGSRSEQLAFNMIVRQVAARSPTTNFIEAGSNLLVDEVPNPAYFVDDGIHLNPAGYRVWGGVVRAGLEAAMPPAAIAHCEGGVAKKASAWTAVASTSGRAPGD